MTTTHDVTATDEARDAEFGRWRRIDIRSIPVDAIPWLLHTYIAYVLSGSLFPPYVWAQMDTSWIAGGAGVIGAWGVVRAIIRWATSYYRVDATRLRFRTGLLVRRHVTVERALIRNVSLRANLVAQALGVTALEASAAQHHRDVAVRLRSIPVSDAGTVRDLLLGERRMSQGPVTLMRGRPSWSLFAPFSSVSVSIWGGVYALVYNLFFAWFAWVRTWYWLMLNDISWEMALRALVVVPVLVGVVGAVVLYLEAWWGYRLDRHPAGLLRVRAGLVVRRDVTFVEDHVVGVEYTEPLATRFADRVRVSAIATGSGAQSTLRLRLPAARKRVLMPLGPAREARETLDRVLGCAVDVDDLVPHPVQARNQRLRWAVAAATLATLVAYLLLQRWAPEAAVRYTALVALVAAVVAPLVAIDNYRALGHRLTPERLVGRWGTWQRRTWVLERNAIVGWVFRQTYFQWRLGLVTVIASTAAGTGGYFVRAVGVREATGLAASITPRLTHDLRHNGEQTGTQEAAPDRGTGR